jgi:hypothetical protein
MFDEKDKNENNEVFKELIFTFKAVVDIECEELTQNVMVQILNEDQQAMRNTVEEKEETDKFIPKGDVAFDTTFDTAKAGELSFFNLLFLSKKESAKFSFLKYEKKQLKRINV